MFIFPILCVILSQSIILPAGEMNVFIRRMLTQIASKLIEVV